MVSAVSRSPFLPLLLLVVGVFVGREIPALTAEDAVARAQATSPAGTRAAAGGHDCHCRTQAPPGPSAAASASAGEPPSAELTAEYPRLAAALVKLDGATLAELQSRDFLTAVICGVGLNHDDRPGLYGAAASLCVADGRGLWQLPYEFASLLLLFRGVAIRRFMDVGPLYGFTTCLFATYLRRFSPGLHVESVDFFVEWAHPEFAATLPITYAAPSTTAAYERGPPFDVVFIDGNHDYEYAMADYVRVGARAKIAAFHDCFDDFVRVLPGGGVPQVWADLRAKHAGDAHYLFYEFRAHPEKRYFGICAVVRTDIAPEFDAAEFERLVPKSRV